MNLPLQTQVKSQFEMPPLRVPLGEYISEEGFELDKRHLFARSWRLAGHSEDIPNPGDYFVRDFEVPKASVIVVRSRDGVIRAFHNVCRHRGNELVRDRAAGCKARFTCSFHGWTWANNGDLLGITDESQFVGLDKSKLGMVPVQCEQWQGRIFLNFQKTPAEPLLAWLEDIDGDYGDYYSNMYKAGSLKAELRTNWNLAVNAFSEGYHTLYIHKNTAGDYQGGKVNPQRHRPFMNFMKRHTVYSAPANPDHRLGPAEVIAYRHGRRMLPAACFDNDSLPPAVNPSRAEHWLFDVVHVFPNLVMMNGQHFHVELRFDPLAADRTQLTVDFFLYRPENLAQRVGQELFLTLAREVTREDLSLLEAQYAALSTGVLDEVYLSRQEMALAQHFKVRNAMIGGEL
ncbi:MAG: aromatic ring-hydroxylating dioxygenase subunit alpha [Sphingomonas sp.]